MQKKKILLDQQTQQQLKIFEHQDAMLLDRVLPYFSNANDPRMQGIKEESQTLLTLQNQNAKFNAAMQLNSAIYDHGGKELLAPYPELMSHIQESIADLSAFTHLQCALIQNIYNEIQSKKKTTRIHEAEYFDFSTLFASQEEEDKYFVAKDKTRLVPQIVYHQIQNCLQIPNADFSSAQNMFFSEKEQADFLKFMTTCRKFAKESCLQQAELN